MFDSFSHSTEKNTIRALNAGLDDAGVGDAGLAAPLVNLLDLSTFHMAPRCIVSNDNARTLASTGGADICKNPCAYIADSSQSTPFNSFKKTASDNYRFISESVSEELEQNLERVNITIDTAERVLAEINVYGEQPEKVIKDLMAKNRVLAVGESHQTPNPQRDMIAQNMSALKEAGATHLAVEMPSSLQPVIDEFWRTGQLDLDRLPNLIQTEDYRKMLQAARDNGIKIVAVDRSDKPADNGEQNQSNGHTEPLQTRDQAMASNIGKILDQDPKNKVIFYVGARHLNRSNIPGTGLAGDYLRGTYSVATIKPVYANSRGEFLYPLSEITTGISAPAAVSTQRAKTLGSLPDSKLNQNDQEYAKDWDYIFIYP